MYNGEMAQFEHIVICYLWAGLHQQTLILAIDAAKIHSGQTEYWPVYILIGDTMHYAHCNGIMLLGFLAIPKGEFSFLNIIYK